jgi:NCAIR mutase (PurE)-related protein
MGSNRDRIRRMLEEVAAGELPVDTAAARLAGLGGVDDLGFARLDTDRERRTGVAEVIFAPGKSEEQLEVLVERSLAHHGRVLATRVSLEQAARVSRRFGDLVHHPSARVVHSPRTDPPTHPSVAVVSAGTSDLPVADEAAVVLQYLGHPVDRVADVGVAGLHRLLAVVDRLNAARALVVVAGMEGALPSVVAGLVRRPVIAVPTSVGYGASFGGLAALLGMLNSCASGVGVVNIDNGFGAASLVHRIAVDEPGAAP